MIDLYKDEGFFPEAGVWEVTLRCNLQCRHCGSRAGRARGEELSLDEKLRLVDDLVALGNKRITLSGGEPLLSDHWHLVAARLRDQGSSANLISNGWLWDEAALAKAQAAGLLNVAFSLDGMQDVHDLIRGRPGTFQRVLDALDLCRREGFPTSVITTVHAGSLPQLDSLAAVLLDHGVQNWQVQVGFDFGNLSDHPELLLPPAALEKILPTVARLKQELRGRLRIDPADDLGYYTEHEQIFRGEDAGEDDIDFWTGCVAGIRSIGIEANGNIKGCLSMQTDAFVEGNVRDTPLPTLWNRPGAFAWTRSFHLDQLGGECRACEYAQYCRGGCSWMAWLDGRAEGKFANRYCLTQVRNLVAAGRGEETTKLSRDLLRCGFGAACAGGRR